MSVPSVLLFDLGSVLVSIHPGAFTRHLGIDPAVARQKYQKGIMERVRRYEGGVTTTGEYLKELSEIFDHRYSQELLREAMLKVIGEPVAGMEDLLRAVAKRTETGLVSNTNELHYVYCMEHFAFLPLLQKHFLSYQLKALKPDPAYYEKVLRSYGRPPSEFLFIDDLEENVRGAEAAGISGILFAGAEDLKKKLSERSFL